MNENLAELRSAAVEFAKAGGDSTLNYFQGSVKLEFKEDQSPVTNADRESEYIIRELIQKHFPDHGIIGEEFGPVNENSEVIWVLDPIDGTQSFIHGVPFYTTLIGVVVKKKPVVGVIYAPALNDMMSAAIGYGCTLNQKTCKIRNCNSLSEATFLTTDVKSLYDQGFEETFKRILNTTKLHRTWGDAYGHMMVAAGRADVMFDAVLNIWDAAALLPVVTEAGGSFTDVHGNRTIESGSAISTHSKLLPEILSMLETN